MRHLNGAGTYYTKLISRLINIKHLVLTQQVKLAEHMALSFFLSALDAELSAGQTITLPPVQKKNTGLFFMCRKASNTSSRPPLSLLHPLDGIYWAELQFWMNVGGWSGGGAFTDRI